MTELDAFIERDVGTTQESSAAQALPVLMFSFAGAHYLLSAEQAVGIIPMRPLTRLPGAHVGLAGAIQDRGRVIALLAHPLAAAGVQPAGVRVVVCRGERGLLGVPVASLDGLHELRVGATPEHGALIAYEGRACTFIDARALSALCRDALGGS